MYPKKYKLCKTGWYILYIVNADFNLTTQNPLKHSGVFILNSLHRTIQRVRSAVQNVSAVFLSTQLFFYDKAMNVAWVSVNITTFLNLNAQTTTSKNLDVTEISRIRFWGRNLDRVCWWEKLLKSFKNSGHLKFFEKQYVLNGLFKKTR